MNRVLLILLAIIGLTSCGSRQTADNQSMTTSLDKNRIEVMYFHGKKRCATCDAIERLTKEIIDDHFKQQVKDGKVVLRVIDISTTEGEKIANEYEVSWSSLFINMWSNGVETRYNMTDFGFTYAKRLPGQFKDAMIKRIEELILVTSYNIQ